MTNVQTLLYAADIAFGELKTALDGVAEKHAWAILPQRGVDYLHTDGSIQGITLHIASCKVIYGSCAFRDTEVRWRDIAERLDTFEPSWSVALAYLDEAQEYWLSCWRDLTDADLEKPVPRFNGDLWPAWRIVQCVTAHDAYHAGQVAMLRFAVGESDQAPPSAAEDIRTYCKDLPSW
jgi:uncharacterized damage-inducible protein DinB